MENFDYEKELSICKKLEDIQEKWFSTKNSKRCNIKTIAKGVQ